MIELDQLIDEVKTIYVEAEFNARWTILEAHHMVGNILLQHSKEEGESRRKFLQSLANQVGKSERTLYYALKFAEKFPQLDSLPNGKAISWNQMVTKFLPAVTDPDTHHHAWFGTLECTCGEKKVIGEKPLDK